MQTVAPLGSLRFQAAPRQLPQIKSITLNSSANSPGHAQQIFDTAARKSQQGTSTLDVLLEAHDQLQRSVNGHATISFSGLESGDIQVSVGTVKSPDEASITGLEGTAKSGKGWGITAFQSRSPEVPSLHKDSISTGRLCHAFAQTPNSCLQT